MYSKPKRIEDRRCVVKIDGSGSSLKSFMLARKKFYGFAEEDKIWWIGRVETF